MPLRKGLPPLSSYKDNTFSAEIQIALTLRNTSLIVNLRRFAAARVGRVLYYEGGQGRVGIHQRDREVEL